jgi:hypothetical protein
MIEIDDKVKKDLAALDKAIVKRITLRGLATLTACSPDQ